MSKIKKTFFATLLVAILALSACAADSPANDGDITIGIIQMMEHPALDLIRTSFLEEMTNLGYTNVVFDHRNGTGDMGSLTTISQIFVGNDVDLIVAIATPAAQAAAAATSTIPIVFSGVTDPIAAGLVENLASPSANITGVSDAIDVEGILQFALDLLPSIQTFGFVYNLGEINSVSLIAEARDFLESQGLSYLEAPVTNTGEVQQAALSLVGNVDAFFTPTDNTVASAMPVFAQVALNAGLPIFTGADSMVHDGGLATVGIDYAIIGAETATVVSQILGGTDISQIPVFYTTNFQPIVNLATANALGINIDHLGDYVELYEGN